MTGQQSAIFFFFHSDSVQFQYINGALNKTQQKTHPLRKIIKKRHWILSSLPVTRIFLGVFFQPPWRFSHVFLVEKQTGSPWFDSRIVMEEELLKALRRPPRGQQKGWLVGWLGETFRPKECNLCFCLKDIILYYLLEFVWKDIFFGKLSELFGIFLRQLRVCFVISCSEFLLTNFPLRQTLFFDSKVNHEECAHTTNHDSWRIANIDAGLTTHKDS